MNKKRLLNVAKALRESKNPEMFTMDDYGHPCGTPGCALGHYAARPDLQDVLVLSDRGVLKFVTDPEGPEATYASQRVKRHFGLTTDEACMLFGACGGGGAETPLQAAKHIERFVANYVETNNE